jgi:ribonuclease III
MSDIHAFAEIIGVKFNDYSLLLRALTHSSYVNENQGVTLEDNERLEFLGDAVIDFVVAAYLYHHFPEMQEGELTSLRAALVRSETLAQFARQLQIGDYLQLGLGEAEHGGRERMPILCATFEAVVGAIYLDQGLAVVEEWLPPLIAPALEEILAESLHKDAKSEFQMWAQASSTSLPITGWPRPPGQIMTKFSPLKCAWARRFGARGLAAANRPPPNWPPPKPSTGPNCGSSARLAMTTKKSRGKKAGFFEKPAF